MITESRDRVVAFLNTIGIETTLSPSLTGFLKHVEIRNGTLRYDPACNAADLLHEAGHIATVPSRWRSTLSGNIGRALRKMCDEAIAEGWHPDDPRYRAVIQCSDPEATAWAWAAGMHIGIEPEDIIVPGDPEAYGDEGEAVSLMLQMRSYLGIHGLQHAGFCRAGVFGNPELPRYPKLAFWLQK